ncbi:MAG: peptide deformylase, partial [Mycobacteriales bacterium]
MAIRPVRLYGDPVLRMPAAPVVDFNGELRQLVTDLIDTMHDEGGVGMAAPQIGVSTRVFVYDIDEVIG